MAVKKPVVSPSSGLPVGNTGVLGSPSQGTISPADAASLASSDFGGTVINKKFDDRLFGTPWGGKIYRGFITNFQPPTVNGVPYMLRFMYNPNEIDYDFSMNPNITRPDQTAGLATLGAMGGQGISFQLYFNRQFDVAYGKDTAGVLQDLAVLKGLVGITDDSLQGYMVMNTLKFVFSSNYFFYGYIDNIATCQLAYFSQNMVPMQLVVSIHATFIPSAANNISQLHDIGDDKNPAPPPAAAGSNINAASSATVDANGGGQDNVGAGII